MDIFKHEFYKIASKITYIRNVCIYVYIPTPLNAIILGIMLFLGIG